MATIEVNSQRINFDETQFFNLKTLIPKIQKKFPFDQYKVEKVSLNGVNIDLHSDHYQLSQPIHKSDYISINIKKTQNNLLNLIDETSELIEKIIQKIFKSVNELKQDQLDDINKDLNTIIEALDIFIQSLTHCLKEANFEASEQSLLPIKELEIHLLTVIKAINISQRKRDYIILADLLEYELKDNLTQWKILVIPPLKQQAQQM